MTYTNAEQFLLTLLVDCADGGDPEGALAATQALLTFKRAQRQGWKLERDRAPIKFPLAPGPAQARSADGGAGPFLKAESVSALHPSVEAHAHAKADAGQS